MNSGASRQRKSFSDTQPFCRIMSEAHSVFQIRVAFSISDGSILMWMRRMIDMGYSWGPPGLVVITAEKESIGDHEMRPERRKSPQDARAEKAFVCGSRPANRTT